MGEQRVPSTIYVISDLHLGGDPDEGQYTRGFKMCRQGPLLACFIRAIAGKSAESALSELVINGDFVDFLAEHPIRDGKQSPEWTAFHDDPQGASEVFRKIAYERERAVFDSLEELVEAGHRLTILLGNHDIELALPPVQQELRRRVDPAAKHADRVLIKTDGKPYEPPGFDGVLIAHGNQADVFNEVDYSSLTQFAVATSGSAKADRGTFSPPRGSRMVARVINDVKAEFPFIDLLKPQGSAMAPLLVALRARTLFKVRNVLPQLLGAGAQKVWDARPGADPRKIADTPAERSPHPAEPMLAALRSSLSEQQIEELTQLLNDIDNDRNISDSGGGLKVRLAAWWLKNFYSDAVFAGTKETSKAIVESVKARIAEGTKTMILGHTHHAVSTDIEAGDKVGQYINTGTWADLMRLPQSLIDSIKAARQSAKHEELLVNDTYAFLKQLRDARPPRECLEQRPTYARLVRDDNGYTATLCCYERTDPAQIEAYVPAASGKGQ